MTFDLRLFLFKPGKVHTNFILFCTRATANASANATTDSSLISTRCSCVAQIARAWTETIRTRRQAQITLTSRDDIRRGYCVWVYVSLNRTQLNNR